MHDAVTYLLVFLLVAVGLVGVLFLPTIIAGMRGHPRLREIRQINFSNIEIDSWLHALWLAFSSKDGVPITPVRRGWRPSSLPPPDLSAPLPDTPAVVMEGTVCSRCGKRADPFVPTCLHCGATLGEPRR